MPPTQFWHWESSITGGNNEKSVFTNFSIYCLAFIVLIATFLSQSTAQMFGYFKSMTICQLLRCLVTSSSITVSHLDPPSAPITVFHNHHTQPTLPSSPPLIVKSTTTTATRMPSLRPADLFTSTITVHHQPSCHLPANICSSKVRSLLFCFKS